MFRRIPSIIDGNLIIRDENCRVCNEKAGQQIAIVDYWNIKTSKLVRCVRCNHIQLDPMLTDIETSKGCYAYYIEQSLRTSETEDKEGVRNFRRGIVFGYSLKKRKISPQKVLELGPGTGYFSAGLQFVFPNIEITVMDIIPDVINFSQQHHQFKVILGMPDNYIAECTGKFDLVIARDIIEHVTDISKVLKNINQYLTPNGYFHFITPNGHEDVWKFYLTRIFTNLASELLINHVNYFDGKGLKEKLIQEGFTPVQYYTINFKTTLKGRGWKKNRKFMSPVSTKKDADYYVNERVSEVKELELVKEKVLDKWYIQNNAKWITYLYSLYQHLSIIRINPELKMGHEIFGLFKKK